MGYQKINLLIKGGYNMTNKALSIFNQLRPVTIGFDNVFDHFERMFDTQFDSISVPNFPPYNIVKTGDNEYDVELALAGFNKKDIDYQKFRKILTLLVCISFLISIGYWINPYSNPYL